VSDTNVKPGKTITKIAKPSNATRLLVFADPACHKAGTITVPWAVP
jgi:hypothetical protein